MKKRTIVGLVAGGLLVMALLRPDDAPPKQAKHLFDRPWVSDVPEDPREAMHALFLSKEHKLGVAVVGSQYQHLVSVLGYRISGEKLNLNFLQQEFKIAGKVKTWKCKSAPKDLDLCLEINYRWKKVKLYSSTKWRSLEDVAHFDVRIPDAVDTSCANCRDGQPRWLESL